MGIGDGSNIGHLGDTAFSPCAADLTTLLAIHGVTVTVTRNNTSGPLDPYGKPPTLPPFTATLIPSYRADNVRQTLEGGRPVEVICLLGAPGTLLEGDAVTYGSYVYDVRNVERHSAAGTVVSESYEAYREVSP